MKTKETKELLKDLDIKVDRVLKMGDVFKFKCTGCGKCCFNNSVLVNCYDIIRLRHALKASTTQILQKGLLGFNIGSFSGLPICTLSFQNLSPQFTKCPFLSPKTITKKNKSNPKRELKIEKWLCSVYQDRPIACRFFPCGRTKNINKKTGEVKKTFFLQEAGEFCPGFKQEKEQTLRQYLKDAEFKHYDEGSTKFASLMEKLLTSGFFIPTKKNDKKKAALKKDSGVFLTLANIMYNFDSFNYFSDDKRVLKTINDPKATQKDFLYVADKIETLISYLIELFKRHDHYGNDDIIMKLIKSYTNKKAP